MKKIYTLSLVCLLIGIMFPCFGQTPAQEILTESDIEGMPLGYSEHGNQQAMIEPFLAKKDYEIKPTEEPKVPAQRLASTPSINTNDFIVLGYAQNDAIAHQYSWQSLTHVAAEFCRFDSTGALSSTSGWTNRAAELKPGGAADITGVKVIFTLANINNLGNFDASILDAVMQNDTYRQTLADNVALIVNSASDNCAGVNLDFEPFDSGTSLATTNGIVDFIGKLRAALNSDKELSMYFGPTYYSTRFGIVISGAINNLDYINYSCYPWSGEWSSTAVAVAPQSSYVTQVNNYLAAGCPPEKMVLTLPSYGCSFNTATAAYGATINSYNSSVGYCAPKFNTTLSATLRTRQYQTGAESPWYSYDNGSDYTTIMYDDEISLATKIRAARSWIGSTNAGRKLRGVGFWSLMWMTPNYSSFDSYDMESGAMANKDRTYQMIYQATLEMLAAPGTRVYPIEKWEAIDYRWRDNGAAANDRKDDVNAGAYSSFRNIISTPAGTGKPDNSTNCMRINFNFSGTNGRELFRYEILGHHTETTKADLWAAKGFFSLNSKVMVDVYTASAYANRTVRMILMDMNGELEQSQQYSLNASGWRSLTWDLRADPVSAYNTNFNQYKDGDGTINTAGTGARDLAIIGFLIENGSSTGSGSVYFDELRWTPTPPGAKNYVINEYRYNGNSKEFVEIYGPAGALPANFELRFLRGDSSSVTTISLGGQTIPNDAGGYGYFVVGDSDTANVDYSTGFGTGVDNILDISPAAIQLYDSSTGYVYDSVVYRAMGGMGFLTRPFALGVTDNGYPWCGANGSGTDNSGTKPYTLGRFPDGNNSFVNFNDFTFMPYTPGSPNGNSITTFPTTYNFTTAPANAFQTYQSFTVANPTTPGLPASPSGGNAHRCVDTTGGGVMSVIGDASLGANNTSYKVSGEIYIQPSTDPVQASAIGICGQQGSTFFTSSASVNDSGYDSGYWLIYENAAGVGLNNGRSDHPGVFEFVYASNDNMDGTPVTLLASKTLAQLGITAGTWTTFKMWIDPNAAASNRLVVMLNNSVVYQGDIPSGGPTSGAFQVGFRENHTGAPAAKEGTWIDNLTIDTAPAVVDAYSISDREVKVIFDKNVDLSSAQTATNYSIPGISFDTATRDGGDYKIVVLHTTASIAGDRTADTLTVNNVQPDGGGPGCVNQTKIFYAGLTAINNIQPNTGTPLNSAYKITTRGIVCANDGVDQVWIADAAGANRGILISSASFKSLVSVGEQPIVVGQVFETNTLTQIQNPILISKTTGTPYAATTVTCADIANTIAANTNPAEQYEGVLVRISSAVATTPNDFSSQYYFSITTDGGVTKVFVDDEVWHQFGGSAPVTIGLTYTITGVVGYDGTRYTLNPRNSGDIVVVNASPTLVNNSPLTVSEGGTGTITTSLLRVTDPEQGPSQLTYTIGTAPTRGTLKKGVATLGAGGTFTQADIDANSITYTHNGSETTADSFTFTVNDGQGGSISSTTFNINVTPQNDAPILTTNAGLVCSRGEVKTIGQSELKADDVDNTQAQLVFTVTSGPSNGTLRLNGSPTTTFTQDDINNNRVSYAHGGGLGTSDNFIFNLSDGAGGLISGRNFNITINPPTSVLDWELMN